tara:strand:+ start:797 stop:967 length:171 start_codon:yes stop_codon:yes gene_type:complete
LLSWQLATSLQGKSFLVLYEFGEATCQTFKTSGQSRGLYFKKRGSEDTKKVQQGYQ